jgi:hypothetical protein
MTPFSLRPRHSDRYFRVLLALVCAALLVPGDGALLARQTPPSESAAAAVAAAGQGEDEKAEKLPPDQLDSLVAPIALYPDDLLAQTLVAATYPLEIVQLQQWLEKNKNLKDKALADAVAKQPWDPAIQSMAAVPEVVKRLADDIQWTTQLGDAFLDQQKDVMDACQRMRKKAQDKGALKTNEQQTVKTEVVEQKTVIVVQQTNPEVIYVPSYSPTVVYPPPVYPYPPIYYPPYYAGAALVTFTAGVMIGAAVWGGACCRCGWGGNNVNINVNNNFNRNTNVNRGGGGGGNWQHNPQHRGGAPYSSSATANKYGGSSKGGSQGSRGASPSASSRGAGGASSSALGGGSFQSGSRSPGAGAGASPSASTAGRGGGGGASPSASTASRGGGGGSSSAFGGGSGGYSGSSARASSSRGSSSMGSRGGGSRGGGGGRRR